MSSERVLRETVVVTDRLFQVSFSAADEATTLRVGILDSEVWETLSEVSDQPPNNTLSDVVDWVLDQLPKYT